MFTKLKELCCLNGTSGSEHNVREYIINKLGDIPYTVDNLGNIIVSMKGRKPARNKVAIAAHMDEVGFIVTYICDDGFIKFDTVGSITPAVLSGRKIVFGNGTEGVICAKPVHLSSEDEKNRLLTEDKLYIYIGADSRADVMKYISLGDTAVFRPDYTEVGNKIISKALDDRTGCAIMLTMIEKGPEYDTTFIFTVQEEVGLRGAGCAINRVMPDYAIVLEATTAADIAGVPEDRRVCVQNKGAVISFMDNSTVYDRELFRKALEIGEKKGISVQVKSAVAGGNDSGIIHKSAHGVRTCAISAPCRYIHSQSNMLSKDDISSCLSLAEALSEYMADA